MRIAIRDEMPGVTAQGTLTLDDLTAETTLRELLTARVYQEVREQRSGARSRGGPLVRSEREGHSVDWKRQVEIATDAFLRNGFFVLVGDRQIASLDEPMMLASDTDVTFVRLLPLVGG